jgi:hypothetical protein
MTLCNKFSSFLTHSPKISSQYQQSSHYEKPVNENYTEIRQKKYINSPGERFRIQH